MIIKIEGPDPVREETNLKVRTETDPAPERSGQEAAAPDGPESEATRAARMAESRERVREYLAAGQKAYRAECERSVRETLRQNRETMGEAERLHDEMCRKANEVQYSWAGALTDAADQLNAAREDLYRFFNNWKKSLYPAEFEQLARNYVDLYRFVRVEQNLTDEVLLGGFADELTGGAALPAPVVERFQKLDRGMKGFLNRFELSLQSLGMYAYFPEPGVRSEEGWHRTEGEEPARGSVVEHCILPGVAMHYNDGGDAVIIPAVVSVRAERPFR